MNKKKKIVIIALAVIVVLVIIGCIIFFSIKKNSKNQDMLDNNDSSMSEVLDGEAQNENEGENTEEQNQDASNEDSQDNNNDSQQDDPISDEELQELLDSMENVNLDTSVKDSGSTISVNIEGEGMSLIQNYNFKDNVLDSIYVDCVMENEESAKEIYEILKEENEMIKDLTIDGKTVSYNSIGEYNSIGAISKDELVELLKEAGLEIN